MKGRADIEVSFRDSRHVVDYFHQSPQRVFLPDTENEDTAEIVLANTSGGLVGGDELATSVLVKSRSSASVTSQAAEKAYRSVGPDTRITVDLSVRSGARLVWVPQPTILFDGVRLRRQTSINVDDGGHALVGEVLVFGRIAKGENLNCGLVHDEWRVFCDGSLAWADNLHLTDDIQSQLNSPAGFNGSRAMATLVYVSNDAPERIDCAKSLVQSDEYRSGATLIGNVILCRWLGRDAAILQNEYLGFINDFSASADVSVGTLHRLWSV